MYSLGNAETKVEPMKRPLSAQNNAERPVCPRTTPLDSTRSHFLESSGSGLLRFFNSQSLSEYQPIEQELHNESQNASDKEGQVNKEEGYLIAKDNEIHHQEHIDMRNDQQFDSEKEEGQLPPFSDDYFLMRAKEYLEVMTIGLIETYRELKITKRKHQTLKENINQIQSLIRNRQNSECRGSRSPASVTMGSESSFGWPEDIAGVRSRLNSTSSSTRARYPSKVFLDNATSSPGREELQNIDQFMDDDKALTSAKRKTMNS
jgi:hypothetical protein